MLKNIPARFKTTIPATVTRLAMFFLIRSTELASTENLCTVLYRSSNCVQEQKALNMLCCDTPLHRLQR